MGAHLLEQPAPPRYAFHDKEGSGHDLLLDPAVKEAYLGVA